MGREDFDIPDDLSPEARKAAETIIAQMEKTRGKKISGGGCRAFYTPEAWAARGEKYGHEAVLIVVHDGGDQAGFFNYDYECYEDIDKMRAALALVGFDVMQCTSWYSAIYRA